MIKDQFRFIGVSVCGLISMDHGGTPCAKAQRLGGPMVSGTRVRRSGRLRIIIYIICDDHPAIPSVQGAQGYPELKNPTRVHSVASTTTRVKWEQEWDFPYVSHLRLFLGVRVRFPDK